MLPFLVRQAVHPVLQLKSGGRVRPLLAELERSQTLPPERLRELQWGKLRRLLDHVYSRVPYYRALFDSRGLHPRDFTGVDDLTWLPALSKEVVRDRGPELMADNVRGPLVERRTSGSTGIPLTVYVYPQTRDAWVAAGLRTHRWWGLDVGMRQIKLINPRAKSRWTLLKQALLMNHWEYSVFQLDEATLERLYRQALTFRCEVLAGYPSALTYFAQHVAARPSGSALGLRAVVTTAEVLYPDQRALLERVFACPVINEYGSSECGYLAGECPEGSLHIAAENALIEFDPGTAADGDGTGREVIVTDLNNLAMPLLRYRIGDVGVPGAVCQCGRTLPVLELRVGRTEDLVTLPDGRKVDGSVFGAVVEELTLRGVAVKQFRAIQHRPDYIEVLISGVDPGDRSVQDLADRLQAMLGTRLTVVVRPVDRIPVEPTGKLRRFVSLIGAP